MGGQGSGRKPLNPKPEPLGKNTQRIIALSAIRELNVKHPLNPKTMTAADIEKRFDEFVKVCADNDLKPIIEDFALALGIDRTTLFRWRNGTAQKSPEIIAKLTECMSFLNAFSGHILVDNDTNPASAIFHTSNSFEGYSDARELKISAAEQLDRPTTEQLADKYARVELIEAVDVEYEEVTDD